MRQQKISEKYIRCFLKNNNLGVLSTVNRNGLPDAAPIYFIAEDNFDIFFIVPVNTQKNINLGFQNDVVLTVTDELKVETLQIRGKAQPEANRITEVVSKLAEKLNSKAEFIKDLPLLKYKKQKKTAIRVIPYEIRMRRFSATALEEKLMKRGAGIMDCLNEVS